ncbi:MAG: helicase RepA family protein, partial [Actinomycetota bacterium]|nr:helicase RepA family protein [Actinomycetota bacterium]
KTTLNGNKLRSLADNVPFLDRFGVIPPDGRVGVLNYELDEDDFLDWLKDIGISRTEKLAPLNMRGRSFSLANPYNAEELVRWCRDMDVEILDLDPHRRAFSGFGKENDNDDVNRFTETLDEVKTEAGVRDLFLYVHMGRALQEEGAEHARGATTLDDWADQRWIITKDRWGERFADLNGRLPDVPEFQLLFDPATRLLRATGGNRRASRAGKVDDSQAKGALTFIAENPGKATSAVVKDGLGIKSNNSSGLDKLLALEKCGDIYRVDGDNNGRFWHAGERPSDQQCTCDKASGFEFKVQSDA